MTHWRAGMITIGQSPRTDVVPDMIAQIGLDFEAYERGALDGLSLDQVSELAPQDDEPWLVSRMHDGTEVHIAKRELYPRMQARLNELEHNGIDLIVPLCASDWSELRCSASFINPGRALPAMVDSMVRPDGRLGVIAPTAAQADSTRKRYAEQGVSIIATHAQPYTDQAEIERQCQSAGELMASSSVDLIYMSCMGHTVPMRQMVREASDRPTVTANGLIAMLMRQMLS